LIKRIIRLLAVTALVVLALALPAFAQEEQTCYDRNGDGTYRCGGELLIPLNEASDFNDGYPPFVYGDEDNGYPPFVYDDADNEYPPGLFDEDNDEEYYDEEFYEDLEEAEEEYQEALEEIYEDYNLEWYSY
jgi:hypothetical protein